MECRGGKIQIFTTAVKTVNATNNSARISGYNHNITFKTSLSQKSSGTQVMKLFFGDYVTSTALPFLLTQQ
jgi:hypothetical protein